jgi:hypothetical protein
VDRGRFLYLLCPLDIGNNLAEALAISDRIMGTGYANLVGSVFRSGFPLRNLVLFSIFIGLSTPDYHQPLYPGNLLLCGAIILLVHFRLRGETIRYVTALAMMGLIPLIQFVGTIIVVGVMAGLIVDRLLRDGRSARLDVALAMSMPTVVAVVGCRMALGSFHAVAAYVRSSLAFSKDYSVTMSTSGPRMELLAAVELVVLLAAALFLLLLWDRDKAGFQLGPGGSLLINIKHGVVPGCTILPVFLLCCDGAGLNNARHPTERAVHGFGAAVVLLCFAILWQDYIARNDLKGASLRSGIRTPNWFGMPCVSTICAFARHKGVKIIPSTRESGQI